VTRGAVFAILGAVLLLGASAFGWRPAPTPPSGPPPAAEGSWADGATLFRAKGCVSCHAGPGARSEFNSAPDLSNAPAWAGRRRPGLTAAEYLRQSIQDPGVFISPAFRDGGGPMTGMPTLSVSEAEVDALVRYLLDA
jgi:cytochrome c1